MDCTVLYYSGPMSAFTVDCENFHYRLHCLGACVRLQLVASSARLEARPLGMQTLGAWLTSLDTGHSTPTGRTPGYNHPLRSLPHLGRLSCLLCAVQTKHSCGTWADVCVRNIIIFIIIDIINKIINNFERKYYY
jgi:hypothetical protein